MRKIIFISLVFFSVSLSAQNAGKNGLSFMKYGFGAKNNSLADLGVVFANDVTALSYNPALLVNMADVQLSLTHNQSIQDVRSEMIGFGFSYDKIKFAIGANTTSIDDIEIRTVPGEAVSTFNASYFYGSFSTGFYLTEQLSAGATIKYLYESMLTDEATGLGFDLGLAYKNVIENLNLGLAVRNLGSMNKLRDEETKLPKDIRFGAAYLLNLNQYKTDITLGTGINKYFEEEDTHFSVAADILYDRLLAIRVGYMTGYEAKGITLGMGINWNSFNFDYAYTPFTYDLGNAHTISVGYCFN